MAAMYMVMFAVVALCVDWAMFERLKMTVGAFGDDRDIRYRDLPLPRHLVAAGGILAFSAHLSAAAKWSGLLGIGAALIVVSTIWSIVAIRQAMVVGGKRDRKRR